MYNEPVKTRPNTELTEIAMVLDRSGSMADMAKEAIGGFNGFLESHQKEPGRAMHRENGAEQDRHEGNSDDAGPQTQDQRDASEHFYRDDDIGELGRQPDAAEKFRRSGRGEDEEFEAGMGKEEDAQADAKQQRGIGSGSGIDHGYLLFLGDI